MLFTALYSAMMPPSGASNYPGPEPYDVEILRLALPEDKRNRAVIGGQASAERQSRGDTEGREGSRRSLASRPVWSAERQFAARMPPAPRTLSAPKTGKTERIQGREHRARCL